MPPELCSCQSCEYIGFLIKKQTCLNILAITVMTQTRFNQVCELCYILKMEMDHHRVARSESNSNSGSNSNEVRTFSFTLKNIRLPNPPDLNVTAPLSNCLQGHHCNHRCHYHHFRTHFTATATASPVASHFTSANHCSSCYHHHCSHNHHCCHHYHCRSNHHHHRLWIESESGALVQYN